MIIIKTNNKVYTYSKSQYNLAWMSVFILGILTGYFIR